MEAFCLYINLLGGGPVRPSFYLQDQECQTISIPIKSYVSALRKEIVKRSEESPWKGRVVKAVYFGGDTGCFSYPGVFAEILSELSNRFYLPEPLNVTLEGFPSNLTPYNLVAIRESGVNEIFLNLFSFQSKTLESLDCPFDADFAESSFPEIRNSGFDRISISLFFGVPGQSPLDFREDLKAVARFSPDTIVWQPLILGEGSKLHKKYTGSRKMRRFLVTQETLIKMKRAIDAFLTGLDFKQDALHTYSRGWSRTVREFQHLGHGDYLGVGPGAWSRYIGEDGRVFERKNVHSARDYVRLIRNNLQAFSAQRECGVADIVNNYVAAELCTGRGLNLSRFAQVFQFRLEHIHPGLIQVLKDLEYIETRGDSVCLSDTGSLVAPNIIGNFLIKENDLEKLGLSRRTFHFKSVVDEAPRVT